jgi:hypothetical protein
MFTDAGAPVTNALGLQVKQSTYAFTTPPDSDYILLRYEIKNTTGTALSGVYVGIFADWDMMPNINSNKAVFEAARSLGYAWDTTASNPNPLYCGIRALDSATGYRGLEVVSASITRSSKYSYISSGITVPSIGGDIHMVVSSGPYTINSGHSQNVAFALIGGKSLALLRAHADAAKAKWDLMKPIVGVNDDRRDLPARYALAQNFPNPFNPVTNISYDLPKSSRVTLTVYDLLGRAVNTLTDKVQEAGHYTVPFDASRLSSGMYFYRLEAVETSSGSGRQFVEVKKLMLVK